MDPLIIYYILIYIVFIHVETPSKVINKVLGSINYILYLYYVYNEQWETPSEVINKVLTQKHIIY